MGERETDWRGIAWMMSVGNLLLGLAGFFGIYAYFTAAPDNDSAYQFLALPMFGFLCSLALWVLGKIAYGKCRADLSLREKVLMTVAHLLPLAGLAVAMNVDRF